MISEANGELYLIITGDIQGTGSGANAMAMADRVRRFGGERIVMAIDSPGGDFHAGELLYRALRKADAHIVTYIDGKAASMAAILALAGDTRTVTSSSRIMVHSSNAPTDGGVKEHAEMLRDLRRNNKTMAAIYADRTGRPESEFITWAESGRDKWFDARQAVEFGFAHKISALPDRSRLPEQKKNQAPRPPRRAAAPVYSTPAEFRRADTHYMRWMNGLSLQERRRFMVQARRKSYQRTGD